MNDAQQMNTEIYVDCHTITVAGTIGKIHPMMGEAYAIMRRQIDDDDAPVTLQSLFCSSDITSPEAAMVGVMASVFGDANPQRVADAFGISTTLAAALITFVSVQAVADPCGLLPAGQRIEVDSIGMRKVGEAERNELMAKATQPE